MKKNVLNIGNALGRSLTSSSTTPAGAIQKSKASSSGRIGSGGLPDLQPRSSAASRAQQFSSKPDGSGGQSKTISEHVHDFKSSIKSSVSSINNLKSDLAKVSLDELAGTVREQRAELIKSLKAKGVDVGQIPREIKANIDSLNEFLKPYGFKFEVTFSDSLERTTKTANLDHSQDNLPLAGISKKAEFERAFIVGRGPSFDALGHKVTPVLTARLIGLQLRVEGGASEKDMVSGRPRFDAGIVQIEAGFDYKSNSIDRGRDGRAVMGGKYSAYRALVDGGFTPVGHLRNVSPRTEKGVDVFLEFPLIKQSPRETSKAFLKRVEAVAVEIAELDKNLEKKRSEEPAFLQTQSHEDFDFVRTVFASHIREAELASFNDANRKKNKNSTDSKKPITDLEIKNYLKP